MKKLITSSLFVLFGLIALQSCNKKDFSVSVSETETLSSRQTLVSNENLRVTNVMSDYNFVTEKYGEIQLKEQALGNEIIDFTFNNVWISSLQLTDFSHVTFEDTPQDLDLLIDRVELVISPDVYATSGDVMMTMLNLGTAGLVNTDFNIASYANQNHNFSLKTVVHFNSEFEGPRSLDCEAVIGFSYEYVTRPIKD